MSTKNREPWINDEVRPRFHGYIVGVFEKLDCPSLESNSEPDHVHIVTCALIQKRRRFRRTIHLGMNAVCAALTGLGGIYEITQACGLG
jgi:Transposase IS200 like